MLFDNKRRIHLRSGKVIERVVRKNRDGWYYVIYNGRNIGVTFACGDWYEIYG